ncbi:efflux transporter outer membrane subunit [Reyranella sp.]|jgi:NodT family efflux transporter outer membrane factor (OMF) lipoprotein|uniref:efflux transporter outer membrane subunit n=1 Tax=Reyranella sp. TaxID=1929291 RepID=UPI000BD86F08|nr:efflux transporter outer membrane subunit [Reyranella sp.]OYY47099.1 MAG: RND transporter [Rhodospirillales bacterium 35-66-84]OYZ97119.1 MAG: RND transporter [Rhodospirillales bacterium 24-66-33]OZB27554.1 MAG: RND transporter [Rhodospirillales bacterium 39-66-50]HQS14036.1 efflux transporter outer membrane subunit [Reyranella sp.]HQT10521.1 efflux transporter outer membrane subunit [Reyranella sp.]
MNRRSPFLVALTAFLLASCTAGPDFVKPDKPTSTGYTPEALAPQTSSAAGPGGGAQTFVPEQDIPGEWWVLFQSPQLDALVRESLQANPDVDAAQAALRQARELYFAQQGSLFPSLSANGSGQQQLASPASQGQVGSAAMFGVTAASLNISYSPDVFGGVRRQVESREAAAENQRFQLEATYLTLSSNVVVAAINLASLQAQIKATQDIIAILNNSLTVVRRQFDLGGASRADVLAQEAALTQTQATLPPLQKQLAQQRNQLMRLVGRSPDQDRGESFDLAKLKLPQELPLSLPSSLVEQRPDVRAAEAQLRGASADIGVAVANQMPQFTITGLLGFTSSGISSLIVPGSGVWSLGLGIAQSVFDGGRLDSQRKAAIAAYERAAAQYRGVVLSAFQDVANALRAVQYDADTLRAQVAAEQTAAASLRLSEQQYQLGAVNYLTLLNAQQTYQTAVINRLKAQAARYSDTAALFQALGGGWWNRNDVDPKLMGKPTRFALPPVQDIKLPRAGH